MCVGPGLHQTRFGFCGYFLFKKGPPTGAKRVGAMTAQSQGNNDVVIQCGHSGKYIGVQLHLGVAGELSLGLGDQP